MDDTPPPHSTHLCTTGEREAEPHGPDPPRSSSMLPEAPPAPTGNHTGGTGVGLARRLHHGAAGTRGAAASAGGRGQATHPAHLALEGGAPARSQSLSATEDQADRRDEPAHHRAGRAAAARLQPWPSPSGRQAPLGRGPPKASSRPRGGYEGGPAELWQGPRMAATGVPQCKDTCPARDSTIALRNSRKPMDRTMVEASVIRGR